MNQHSVKLTPCMRPEDATHRETDGTFWKNEKGHWYHWNKHFQKWCAYVGSANQAFLNKLILLG